MSRMDGRIGGKGERGGEEREKERRRGERRHDNLFLKYVCVIMF